MKTTATRERPILFSTPMICAILSGEKTQTRRVVKPQPPHPYPNGTGLSWHWSEDLKFFQPHGTIGHIPLEMKMGIRCPYGMPGDRLWVRETWGESFQKKTTLYRADFNPRHPFLPKWKPSIHMRRIDSRILLEISDVRVQQVQEISEDDAIAEGARTPAAKQGCLTDRAGFKQIWEAINGKRPGCAWQDNPFVWAITFQRVVP